jgi:tetratricopeptide (TPR) repeat protein
MYYLSTQYDSARIYYKKSLALSSKEYNVWQNLFYTLSSLQLYREMADSTNSALEYFPANAFVHLYNGLANMQLEKYEQAEKSYRKSLRFLGENKELEAQVLSSLGELYHKQKKYDLSDESFDEALKVIPDNAYTLNNYAYYLSLRKVKLEKAKSMSRKSLDLDANNTSFLDTYAWINFQLGKLDEAKFYQEKALELAKEDRATLYDHYGDILFKLNDVENALKNWNKAKENGSKNKVLPAKISGKKYIEEQE